MRPAGALWSLAATLRLASIAKAAGLSLLSSQGGQLRRASEQKAALHDLYQHDGHWCEKCPPGTYVSAHCTSSKAQGTCLPCPDDTYFQHKNQYETCSNCKICRPLGNEHGDMCGCCLACRGQPCLTLATAVNEWSEPGSQGDGA